METPKIFTTNQYGVSICKCCASCVHKQIDNRGRICTNGEGTVPPTYVCGDWSMSPELRNAGMGDGRIKRKSYLKYSLDRFFGDNEAAMAAAERKVPFARASIAQVRREYERRNGSVYADL